MRKKKRRKRGETSEGLGLTEASTDLTRKRVRRTRMPWKNNGKHNLGKAAEKRKPPKGWGKPRG